MITVYFLIQFRLESALFHLEKIIQLLVLILKLLQIILILFSLVQKFISNKVAFTFRNVLGRCLVRCNVCKSSIIFFVFKTGIH